MAKRKKRRSDDSSGFKYPIEIKGIIFIVIAVIGFLGYKANILGQIIKGFTMFLMGSFYFIVLIFLLITGGYMLVQREKPKYFSSRMIGIYIFLIGLLSLAHINYIENDLNFFDTMKDTIDEILRCVNTKTNYSGGGIIGASFIYLFNILLGKTGSIIVIGVLMLIGILLISNFSISEAYSFIKEKFRKKNEYEEDDDEQGLEEYDDETEGDDEVLENKKIKISSISELTHSNVEEDEEEEKEEKKENASNRYINYKLPAISLLTKTNKNDINTKENEASIRDNIKRLEEVLNDFEVFAKVKEVHVGPSITQYELEVKSGTKMNKIKSLSSEIALALAATDVRIQAPIPGKNTVGIELPNKVSVGVSFRDMMLSFKDERYKSDNKLRVALGKDIMGEPEFMDINKMPHLLIAGSTGSGKSVCVNCIISTLLMRAKPDEVKLIMVDPKKVELSMYNAIPHLLMPVITDPKKASAALQKVVEEMMNRYDKFEDSKTKNIEGYNNYLRNKNKDLPEESKLPLLPYMVVIIDELADLMVVAKKEVEDSIMRITQMARAAGIHLIVATQRPSTDVITGIIKANIPSRIAFAVSSSIDSRTILDSTGAEKLLGKGDMLFDPMGATTLTRIQGAFISEEDVLKIVDACIAQQKATYDESFMNLERQEEKKTIDKDDVDTDDPLYNEIVEFVITTGKASASLLQRRYKLGYNRAARIIDLLEERGIIGPQNGSKPREVLVSLDDDEE